MRQRFQGWGAELSDSDFACALAALGVVYGSSPQLPVGNAVQLAQLIAQQLPDKALPLSWQIPHDSPWRYRADEFPARMLAEAWRTFVTLGGQGARIRLIETRGQEDLWAKSGLDPLWVAGQLSRPEVGAASVHVELRQPHADVRWDWPVSLGLLGDPVSAALHAALRTQDWREDLYHVTQLDDARPVCDLLVLPMDLRAAAGAVLAGPRGLRAGCIAVLGRIGEPGLQALSLATTMTALTRSGGIVLARTGSTQADHQAEWLRSLIHELAHDLPIDVALARNWRNQDWPRRPVLLADPRLLDVTRVSTQARLLVNRLRRIGGETLSVSPPTLDSVLGDDFMRSYSVRGGDAGVVEASGEVLAGKLEERLKGFEWASESGDASSVAEIQREARAVEGKRVEEAAPRFLQAQLYERAEPFRLVRGSLQSGMTYQANVQVGLPGPEWKSVAEPFPTPAEPPEERGHRLTVVFWEPQVSPEPQVETLWLPQVGSSEPCSFFFHVQESVRKVAARITVLHRNRVLQTGVLEAPVGGDEEWSFGLDAVPRARLEGLSARSHFDVALVLNHDGEGTPRLTAAADDQVAVVPVGDNVLERLTKFLGDQISEIAAAPERYTALTSDGTEELLRNLAQIGGEAHESLCKHTFLGKILAAERPGQQPRIHLTSARVDSFFPIELLYRFEAPEETATICQHAAAGLAAGACPDACPADKSQTVCPLGFWGLCRVIERHAHRPEHTAIRGEFELRPEPLHERSPLRVSGQSLLAASDKATEVQKDAVTVLLEKLQKRGPAALVSTWADWEAHIASDGPTLLVLLPHHERKGGFELLEIGASDRLKSQLIKEKHVRVQKGNGAAAIPIVLLMGCETNLTKIAFDNFATRFLDEGAAVVVSTIATILGRHASPATVRLVELLDELARQGDHTFGEVMLRLRRSLVASESPMALGLTAYGDADWVLTAGG